MILEEHVESAWQSLLAADSAVATLVSGGAVIRDFRDNSAAKSTKMIVVHALPAERIAPNYNLWRVPVEFVCATHQADDKSRATCEGLYQAVQSVVAGATKTTLGAKLPGGSTVTVDGIVMTQGDEGADESHQFISAKADVFATKAP